MWSFDFVLVSHLVALFQSQVDTPPAAGWHMHDWANWWGAWHMVIPLIFWSLIIVAAVLLVGRAGLDKSGTTRENRALNILDERYAKGEIGHDEYVRRRQDITGA
jgi:putative membrane protein